MEGKNLFGVKAHGSWRGDILTLNTREFLNGTWVTVPAHWRQYANKLVFIMRDDQSLLIALMPAKSGINPH